MCSTGRSEAVLSFPLRIRQLPPTVLDFFPRGLAGCNGHVREVGRGFGGMTPYTYQQFVTESFAKLDSQVHEMIDKGVNIDSLLAVVVGNLQGVLEHLARRIDELAIPT